MKKLMRLTLAVITLLSLMTGIAFADGGSWYCNVCRAYRNTEFCPDCGARRPAGESSGAWPVIYLTGTGTKLRPLASESDRHQSYLGPDRKAYKGAGAYKPYKVSSATALFREGDYVLVDMSYTTVGRRCVYFRASSLTNASVDYVELTAYPAVVTTTVQPLYGPGDEYDSMVDNVTDKKTGKTITNRVLLDSGLQISVFFETDGWVFAEFDCVLGAARGWLPVSVIR